jgi:cation diffusion facilitator family transporter
MESYVRTIRWILVVVLCVNWGVACGKLLIGYAISSISMMADGIHSLSDGLSNIIGLVATLIAGRPADATHPYGHKKFETLAALAIAGLLFAASINIIGEGVQRLFNPVIPQITLQSIVVMGTTIVLNILVTYFEFAQGKRLKSDVLIADAMHTRSDIVVSSGVLLTLFAVQSGYFWIDAVASLGIAVSIAWAGWEILMHCAGILCDGSGLEPMDIYRVVTGVEGVLDCHKIRSRGREDYLFLDLHILVDRTCSLQQAHSISHRVEAELKKIFPGVMDVVIHVEPFGDRTIDRKGRG